MPNTTFSSTSTSSDYTSGALTLGQASSYPRELEIDGFSFRTSTSDRTTAPPLMPYSTPFTSNWKKDFGCRAKLLEHQGKRWKQSLRTPRDLAEGTVAIADAHRNH
ncbi:hypothetical protein F5Y09DRAFT_344878 [Xylaria sp. FL1042]|nr:hypothetical protein F5Y09DRAFT_344878 [Xylaria sp. FL1042]